MTNAKVSLPGTGVNLPISSFEIGGRRIPDLIINGITLRRAAGKHDSAIVACRFSTTNLSDLDGQRISFRLGSSPTSTRFYGYVYSVGKAQKLNSGTSVQLTCIGATQQAKAPMFGMLLDVTAEDVAAKVLPKVGYGFSSSGSQARIPRMSLTGRSAWDAVTTAARLTGRMVSSMDGAVWIFDPLQELAKAAPRFVYRKALDQAGLGSGDRDLLDFTPGSVPQDSTGDLPRTAWFASDNSIKTMSPKGAEEDSYWASTTYIPSSGYAQILYDRVERENKITQTATARVRGTPAIIPGNVVAISTGMTRLLTDTYDGVWLVTKVDHAVAGDSFQSNLGLIRDKYRKPSPDTYEQFYERDRRMYPTMRVSGDKWVSSWKGISR
jgi:hypothetical protein